MNDGILYQIVAATGLPAELISRELRRLLQGAGLKPAEATLEEIREVLATYLVDVLPAAKEELEKKGGAT